MTVSQASTKAWPADKVERRKVADLLPYARNARTHSPDQVAQIARSIDEFGWTIPVLVDADGTIIAGHGRVLAAKRLKLDTVPVMVATGWTEAQRRAYVIADNQLALNAGWDEDVLREELRALGEMGADLSLTGFDDVRLASFIAGTGEGLTDQDDVPDEPAVPVSRLGDVWLMGGHRVVCGDSTDAATVAALLDGAKPHLMVTDPPYGVEYDADWRDAALGGNAGGRATGAVKNDDRASWAEAWALFPGDVAYVWHGERQLVGIGAELEASGFALRNLIVWGKSALVVGRGNYHSQHETCWYAVRKTGKGHWSGDRKQTTLWQIEKPKKSETGHSTQKPVECMKRPIENNSVHGDAVYEPFLGSGTTVIAGEQTGRRVYGVELSPTYVDVAVRRWEAFTGREAILDGTSSAFAEIAAQRGASEAA
jgi:DNA modification methylase